MERGGSAILPRLVLVSLRKIMLLMSRPTLETDFHRFFSMTDSEKTAVPLSCFSLNLMICSLGRLDICFGLTLGVMMRASIREIFGTSRESEPHFPKREDLTSSRLQSELYRELR